MPGGQIDEGVLPDALLSRDQWLCWSTEARGDKETKVPIDPTGGGYASTADPTTWTSFERAHEVAATDRVEGVGFVFTDDDPVIGVDLDDCRTRDPVLVRDWAQDVIDRLDSYTEVSPSGSGFHVLVTGTVPTDRNRHGDLEVYETGRFFTVTGDHVDGTPQRLHERTEELAAVTDEYLQPEDREEERDVDRAVYTKESSADGPGDVPLTDEELLTRARDAANGEKFTRLWEGQTSGYDSHSEADMALCSLLAFWTAGDEVRIDRLFRQSGLMREKWDEVHYSDGATYGERTVERAVAGSSEFYEPPDAADESKAEGEETSAEVTSDTISDLEREIERLRERERSHLERIQQLERTIQNLQAKTEQLGDTSDGAQPSPESQAKNTSKHSTELETATQTASWFRRTLRRFTRD